MPSVVITQAHKNPVCFQDESAHVLSRLGAAAVDDDPFPHAIVTDFLSPSLFKALHDSFPKPGSDMASVRARRRDATYSEHRWSVPLPHGADPAANDLPDPIRRLHAVLTDGKVALTLLQMFGDVLSDRMAAVTGETGLAYVTIGTAIELIYDRSGFALLPHTDGSAKLATGLLYIADPDDPVEMGTQFYAPVQPDLTSDGADTFAVETMRPVKRAPYEPNNFVCFGRSDRSFHGVESIATTRPRRLVQYSIKLV